MRTPGPPDGASWRADAERAQEAVLPSGRVVVSCSAPLGSGGLGRHLEEIVDACHRAEQPTTCVCGPVAETASRSPLRRVGERALGVARSLPPMRSTAAGRMLDWSVEFDADAARRLPAADHLIAFNGTALEQMRAAREIGWESVSVMSATSHFRRVVDQHARAHRQYPLEGSWATLLLERNLTEYGLADRIYVTSQYVRDSFIEEGFPEQSIRLFPLTPAPRFQPGSAPAQSQTFDIVYIGSLTVVKGTPLLIDAVRALPFEDIRLVLVGGWTSRAMRRFVQRACAEDPRIVARRGDPLPHLRAADLYVHPSYNDGFAYAPVEALACGLPVIVSEDTGMKDLLDRGGSRGAILPTGDLGALTEAIEAAYSGGMLDR